MARRRPKRDSLGRFASSGGSVAGAAAGAAIGGALGSKAARRRVVPGSVKSESFVGTSKDGFTGVKLGARYNAPGGRQVVVKGIVGVRNPTVKTLTRHQARTVRQGLRGQQEAKHAEQVEQCRNPPAPLSTSELGTGTNAGAHLGGGDVRAGLNHVQAPPTPALHKPRRSPVLASGRWTLFTGFSARAPRSPCPVRRGALVFPQSHTANTCSSRANGTSVVPPLEVNTTRLRFNHKALTVRTRNHHVTRLPAEMSGTARLATWRFLRASDGIRTRVNGFAGRCLATQPHPHRGQYCRPRRFRTMVRISVILTPRSRRRTVDWPV